MPSARLARILLLLALAPGCGRPAADSHPPDAPGAAPVPAEVEVAPVDEAAPAEAAAPDGAALTEAAPAGERTAAQTISFADDTDPEPTPHIQGQPKRPPLPRFRLFGTRDGDGPN